jgi:hypothetical protein
MRSLTRSSVTLLSDVQLDLNKLGSGCGELPLTDADGGSAGRGEPCGKEGWDEAEEGEVDQPENPPPFIIELVFDDEGGGVLVCVGLSTLLPGE